MEQNNNQKAAALDDLKIVFDDIYSRINEKADKRAYQEFAKNQVKFATTSEIITLIPTGKTLTLLPFEYGVSLCAYYKNGDNSIYKGFVKGNEKLPWDIIDCRYILNLNRLFDDSNTAYTSLTKIPKVINTSNAISLGNFFSNQAQISTVPAFDDLSKCKNISYMFEFCANLREVPDFPHSSENINVRGMFNQCHKLEKAPKIYGYIEDASHMFNCCESLKEVPEYDLSRCKNMNAMFYNCKSLPSEFPWAIDLQGLPNGEDCRGGIGSMFGCSSVKKIKLKNVPQSLNPDNPDNVLNGSTLKSCLGYSSSDNVEITIENYRD